MKVVLHLGEPFWRTVSQRELELALPAGSTVAEAFRAAAGDHPALASDLLGNGEAHPAVFVGDEAADLDTVLDDGARIHVLWPISGG